MSGYSCETQLIVTEDDLARNVEIRGSNGHRHFRFQQGVRHGTT